jgi:hypothetical protein
MARIPTNSRESVRAAIISLLAEAGHPAPASRAEFRRHVSVRNVRDRLGAGDATWWGGQMNQIEEELVAAGRARLLVPGIPEHVSHLMQEVWTAAIDAQTSEVIRIQAVAAESVANAKTADRK